MGARPPSILGAWVPGQQLYFDIDNRHRDHSTPPPSSGLQHCPIPYFAHRLQGCCAMPKPSFAMPGHSINHSWFDASPFSQNRAAPDASIPPPTTATDKVPVIEAADRLGTSMVLRHQANAGNTPVRVVCHRRRNTTTIVSRVGSVGRLCDFSPLRVTALSRIARDNADPRQLRVEDLLGAAIWITIKLVSQGSLKCRRCLAMQAI